MSRVALVATLAALCSLCSCGERPSSGSVASSRPAAPASPDALCEHGVLAEACPKCNAALEPIYRSKGDWCGEHGLPESFCPICHPELGGRPAPKVEAKKPASSAKVPADGTLVRIKAQSVLDGMGLETAKATPATEGVKLVLPARLAYDATKTAEINARSPGVVRKLLVDVGATVKAGAPLAVLESADVGADRARLVAARKRVEVAEDRAKRLAELEREGAASRRERLDAERELGDARAEAGALSSELSVAGAGAGSGASYTLTSPLDGTVAKRGGAMGTLVGPADVLFQIVDATSLWAEIDVPESDLGAVLPGGRVVVAFAALPKDAFAAEVTSVAPEVDPHTRTAIARARLDNTAGKLKANMFGEASVLGPVPPKSVSVPTDAVQMVGTTRIVFVRKEALVFAVRHIEVEPRRGERFVVRAGLAAGEEVVTTGAFLLKTETLKDSIGAGCCEVD
jgi:cobalt-zinc-cadmium efflux system membrane fusion protein